MLRPESMVSFPKDVVPVCMSSNVRTNNMLKQLACYGARMGLQFFDHVSFLAQTTGPASTIIGYVKSTVTVCIIF